MIGTRKPPRSTTYGDDSFTIFNNLTYNDDELSQSGLYERVHFAIEFESKHPLKYDYGT